MLQAPHIYALHVGTQCTLHIGGSSWSITSKQSCHAQHRTRRWHGKARHLQPVSGTTVNRQFVTHEEAGVPLPLEDQLEERLAAVPQTLNAFYRFSRPHTMLGTFISVLSVSALAVVSATVDTSAWRYCCACCQDLSIRI